mgnify:FL=1
MKKNIILIEIITACFISLVIALLCIQPSLFFHPWHDEASYNQLLSEPDFEEIQIDNNGKLIHGWFKFNTSKQPAPLLIFFGGNVQNSSNTCLNYLKNDNFKYFENYNFMIVDYPGYGLSEGKTSEKTMFNTALKAYDYATSLDYVDNNNIVVLGYSIGTGVATYLASERTVNGLILVAPYDRALSLYNSYVNIFYGPLKFLARYKLDSISYAKKVNVTPLIITSYDDEVINYKLSLNLSRYFKYGSKILTLDNNVKHNDYFSQDEVLNSIYDYLQNLK